MISKGRYGVRGFARKSDASHHHSSLGGAESGEGLLGGAGEREAEISDAASVTSSVMGAGKPWKRHNNKNKKEKTRRTARPLNPYQ